MSALQNEVARRVADSDTRGRASEFADLALLILQGKGMSGAKAIAEARGRPLPRSIDTVFKEVESAADLSDSIGFHGLQAAFADSLAWSGVFDRMLPSMIRVQFLQRVLAATSYAVGSLTSEGEMKALSRFALGGHDIDRLKTVAQLVLSNESLEFASAGTRAFVERELRRSVTLATDETFLAAIALALTPLASVDPAADVAALLAEVSIDTSSALFFIVAMDLGKGLAMAVGDGGRMFPTVTPTGGTIAGVPVVVTDALDAGEMMLVNASSFAAAADALRLDVARHANVVDAELGEGPSEFSLWQRNASALKIERHFGFRQVRDNAAAIITGATWGLTPDDGEGGE
jgi:hypothetical protein